MRLKDRTAIITGGASGFGAGIARKFVNEGAMVMIADINGEAAAALALELGPAATSCVVDVSSASDMQRLASASQDRYASLDIMINNAGITHLPMPMDEVSEADFDHVLAVNTRSVYLSARYIIPLMKQQGHGVVLNVASTAGVSPRPNLTWYNASKGWMITATRSMAIELAPFCIRVNALNPVAGETPLLKSFMGEDTPEVRARFLSTIPLGRFSTPEDMGHAACYLCSDEASMVTGVCLQVDGGRCI